MTSPNHSDVFAAFIEADAALKQVPALKTEIETLQSQLRHKEAEAEHWRTTADRTADKNAEQYEHIRSLEVERDEYGFRAIDAEDKLEKLSSLAGTVLASIKSSVPVGLSSKAEIEAHVPAGVSSEALKPEIEAQPQGASGASEAHDSYPPTLSGEQSSIVYTPYTIASEARTDQGNGSQSDEGKLDGGVESTTANAITTLTASNLDVPLTTDSQRDISPTASTEIVQSPIATSHTAEETNSASIESHSTAKPYAGMLYRDWLSGWNNLGQVTYDDFVKGGGNYSAYIDDHMHDTL